MDIKEVEFTETESKKVFAVMDKFNEAFCDFAKATNVPLNEANLLIQGAMMAFATFSCVNPFSTTITWRAMMNKLYGYTE